MSGGIPLGLQYLCRKEIFYLFSEHWKIELFYFHSHGKVTLFLRGKYSATSCFFYILMGVIFKISFGTSSSSSERINILKTVSCQETTSANTDGHTEQIRKGSYFSFNGILLPPFLFFLFIHFQNQKELTQLLDVGAAKLLCVTGIWLFI